MIVRLRTMSLSLAAVWIGCSGFGAHGPEWEQWKADWNARVDAAEQLEQNPCGDFEFDPWADAFLKGCDPVDPEPGACSDRARWVWERSRQCDKWQTWLLRHHNKRERVAQPEPQVRVE